MLWAPSGFPTIGSTAAGSLQIGTGDFTFATWWWMDSLTASTNFVTSWSATNFLRHISGTAFNLRLAGVNFNWGPGSPSVRKWHHLAVTRSNGVIYGYFDGALATSAAHTATLPTSGTLYVGGSASTYGYRGGICDWGWWRHAHGAADIAALYRGAQAPTVLGPAVVYVPGFGASLAEALCDKEWCTIDPRWTVTPSGVFPVVKNGYGGLSDLWAKPTPKHVEAAAPGVAAPALFHAHYMSQGMRP